MQIVIISRTLATLQLGDCKTSSQLFELGLARALSRHAEVVVFSAAVTKPIRDGGVNLVRVDFSRRPVKRLKNALHEHHLFGDTGSGWLMMYGYDPKLLASLKVVGWLARARVVAYVFDSHLGAIEHKTFSRRIMLNAYFRTGIHLLRFANSVLLLNKDARPELGIKRVPTLVSRVGIEPEQICEIDEDLASNDRFTILFAGSLESYNGVLPLIASMRFITDQTVRLDILGAGSLSNEVLRLAGADERITYHGLLAKSRVDEFLRTTNLVVNLRDLKHPVSRFSFPSKLIEFMASGVPVMSTRVIDGSEFAQVVNVVSDLEPRTLAESIISARANSEEQVRKAVLSSEYVRQHHLWDPIGAEVFEHLARQSGLRP